MQQVRISYNVVLAFYGSVQDHRVAQESQARDQVASRGAVRSRRDSQDMSSTFQRRTPVEKKHHKDFGRNFAANKPSSARSGRASRGSWERDAGQARRLSSEGPKRQAGASPQTRDFFLSSRMDTWSSRKPLMHCCLPTKRTPTKTAWNSCGPCHCFLARRWSLAGGTCASSLVPVRRNMPGSKSRGVRRRAAGDAALENDFFPACCFVRSVVKDYGLADSVLH